eukprot:Ihof_evm3s128 gene=Ihof_evmTU3s128
MSAKVYIDRFSQPEFGWAPSDVCHFKKNGFLTFNKFLTPSALAFLRDRIDEVYSVKHPSVHSEWVMSLHQILPRNNWLWKLATHPKLLDIVEQLLGPDLVLYTTQLVNKPPGGGRCIPWHQDGEQCLTVWIPLDDIEEANGGLIVKPGWHTRERMKYKHVKTEKEYEDAVFNMQHSVFEIDLGMSEEEFTKDAIEYQLPAGALTMHHPGLPHCSHPNRTNRHRRVIILRYQPSTEPLTQNRLIHYVTGEEFKKCNYVVRGKYGSHKAGATRTACELD